MARSGQTQDINKDSALSPKNPTEPGADVGAVDNQRDTLVASDGAGPLLQRDYWATIHGSACTPEEAVQKVLKDFPEFSPRHLAEFSGDTMSAEAETATKPLSLGDEMQIQIKMTGLSQVRIVHIDERSMTMRTLKGHPEAGRITFGAYYDAEDHLIFRIRSRARASSSLKYVGYELFGKAMQTEVWITFVQRVAEACGGTIQAEVQVNETEVSATVADTGELDTPTFVARDRK
ncbi:MAG: DUF1990 family protein [Abitibacteriaceae bacterium]|nr:DUF1990 family protein [Abditibacteriaceae bacterium]MBV9866706.1 DUF1990 family protein [Abditibacteriaceae bacterium]